LAQVAQGRATELLWLLFISAFFLQSFLEMSAPAVSKPTSAYWLWLGDNRASIVTALGSGKGSEVAKKAGEMWKVLSDAARIPYDKQAKAKKEEYEKFIATEEGQKALQDKKSSKADEKAEKDKIQEARDQKNAAKAARKNEKESKAAVKAIVKDDALKKPTSAYWLWLGDNRERIASELGTKSPTEVSKKAGEVWKTVSDVARKPYEKKAQEQKETYEKYIATPAGAEALKAFKDAQQAAKDQFKPKEVATVESPAGDEKKRKATEETPAGEELPAKKVRGRPAKIQSAALGA